MGPFGHVGITVGAAYVINRVPHLRLNLWVVAVSSLLPDLVDKPLYLLGIGDGRYVGHTLLFVFLAAAAVSLKNRIYGLSVLFGAVLHLLLDWSGVPWLYPFVSYDFAVHFDPGGIHARLSTLLDIFRGCWYSPSVLVTELLGLTIVLSFVGYLCWRYFRVKRSVK